MPTSMPILPRSRPYNHFYTANEVVWITPEGVIRGVVMAINTREEIKVLFRMAIINFNPTCPNLLREEEFAFFQKNPTAFACWADPGGENSQVQRLAIALQQHLLNQRQ